MSEFKPDARPESVASPAGLPALEDRVRQDLAWLDLPAKPWIIPREHEGQPVLEVAIIGAGMAGMTAAIALRFLGIPAVLFDRAPAGVEGPWVTTARMDTLRSPKQLAGPALGVPSLTFRAWFEAQFGLEAWEALDKISRVQWMDYLRWYRQVLAPDVRNDHEVLRVEPRGDGLVALRIRTPDGERTTYARRVVIASGRDGIGGPYVPAIASDIPRKFWAHSSDEMDYALLAGKRVGVVGAGASAMDSAGTALECGAARVEMLIRRTEIPRVNKGKGAGNPGLVHGHVTLPDDWKWRIRHHINAAQVPPPRGSTLRVSQHPNVRFNVGCPLESIDVHGDALRVHTPLGVFDLDFLIFSTGFRIDWGLRPEYGAFAPHVRAWKHGFAPPEGLDDVELSDSPYLGPAFELQDRDPGSCPGIDRIHCFCYPAALSHGTVSGDIPAISDGARRMAQAMAALFYREDIDAHFERLRQYDEPELLGDEIGAAQWVRTRAERDGREPIEDEA